MGSHYRGQCRNHGSNKSVPLRSDTSSSAPLHCADINGLGLVLACIAHAHAHAHNACPMHVQYPLQTISACSMHVQYPLQAHSQATAAAATGPSAGAPSAAAAAAAPSQQVGHGCIIMFMCMFTCMHACMHATFVQQACMPLCATSMAFPMSRADGQHIKSDSAHAWSQCQHMTYQPVPAHATTSFTAATVVRSAQGQHAAAPQRQRAAPSHV